MSGPPKGAKNQAAPQEPAERAAHDIDAAIEGWWNDHFPGSPVAAVTPAWNTAVHAKEDLKRRLAALFKGDR